MKMTDSYHIIRKIRKEKNLTLSEVVEAAKEIHPDSSLTVSYLSMIENGERKPDAKKLNEIASGLGIPAMRLRIGEFLELLESADLPEDKRKFALMIKDLLEVAFPNHDLKNESGDLIP
jgi:transcriptional regulator with XRE-family HTH domain